MSIPSVEKLGNLINGIEAVLPLPAETTIVFEENYKGRGGVRRLITIGELTRVLEKSTFEEDFGWRLPYEVRRAGCEVHDEDVFGDFTYESHYYVWKYELDYQI
jgi:hypothetical protein